MRYVFYNGQMTERNKVPQQRIARSDLPAPMIVSDNMDYLLNHADGRMYGSKRGFEKAVRAQGCEIVGNDTSVLGKRPSHEVGGVEQDIKQAIAQLSEGA